MLVRLLIGVLGGLVMLVVSLVAVALLMRWDVIEQWIPSVELEPQASTESSPDPPDETAEIPPFDCAGAEERLVLRVPVARSCRSDQDCVLSVGRERCITALNIGLAGSIEAALVDYRARCDGSPERVFDALDCRSPDDSRIPRCIDSICEAAAQTPDALESTTRDHLNRRGRTRSR